MRKASPSDAAVESENFPSPLPSGMNTSAVLSDWKNFHNIIGGLTHIQSYILALHYGVKMSFMKLRDTAITEVTN